MECTNFNITDQNFNLNAIKPFSSKILNIPKYVFENCNQVTCNKYSEQYLSYLRKEVKHLTPEKLSEWCQGKEKEIEKKGEEMDWVNGLDTLENEFFQGKEPSQILNELLTVETVMRYNGIFSRFANHKPGQFRERDIIWPKHDYDMNENVAQMFFSSKFQDMTSLTLHEYCSQTNPKIKKCMVKKSWFLTKVAKIRREDFIFEGSEKIKDYLFSSGVEQNLGKAFSEWSKEQNRNDDKIDLVKWFKDRNHFFPLVSSIRQDLEHSLAVVREGIKMHPIEKACRVWFDIVRIHISHEANKRTGKALASVILLSYGYLPPIIDAEDEKEYLRVLREGFNEENGHRRLTQFAARLILKTQEKF